MKFKNCWCLLHLAEMRDLPPIVNFMQLLKSADKEDSKQNLSSNYKNCISCFLVVIKTYFTHTKGYKMYINLADVPVCHQLS